MISQGLVTILILKLPTVVHLGRKIEEVQGIIFSTPEYNGGIPNAIGTIRGLAHSRVPLESIGAFVYPQTFGLAKADQALDQNGNLKDQDTQQQIEKLLISFTDHVSLQYANR